MQPTDRTSRRGPVPTVADRAPAAAPGDGAGPAPTPPTRRLRHVDGLRALAVLLVVGYHAGVPVLGGGFVGVDVFFVLSGFLITGLLLGELARTGTVDLPRFWARRARRLLPAATLVLLVVMLAATVVVAPVDRAGLAREGAAAAVFGSNWFFAWAATDYWAADAAQSPLLHYWSLAVEEQFYLLWPPLLLVVTLVWRRVRGRADADLVVAALLLVVGAASLATSVLTTADAGTLAYYGLHTRAWELALGGLVAVVVRRAPPPGAAPALLAAVVGLLLLGWAAVTFSPATVFPGAAALLPTGGTALVLLAGAGPGNRVLQALGTEPAARLGEVSYAWYLWHWPVLVLVSLAAGGTAAGPTGWGVPAPVVAGAVLLSLVLAVLTYRLVENPVRFRSSLVSSTRRSLALGAGLVIASLLSVTAVASTSSVPAPTGASRLVVPPGDQDGTRASGAAPAPAEDATDASDPPRPPLPAVVNRAYDAASAREDKPTPSVCHDRLSDGFDELEGCVLGDPDGDVRIAMVGDSHAFHLAPAVDRAGGARGWRVEFWSASACGPADVETWLSTEDRPYVECDAWRDRLLSELASREPYDLLVLARAQSGAPLQVAGDGGPVEGEAAVAAFREGSRRTFEAGLAVADSVVVLRDTPWPGQDVPRCLSAAGEDPSVCGYSRSERALRDQVLVDAEKAAAQGLAVRHVDPTPLVCEQERCEVVDEQGVVVFRDGHHLTATYARVVADRFAALLEPSLG